MTQWVALAPLLGHWRGVMFFCCCVQSHWQCLDSQQVSKLDKNWSVTKPQTSQQCPKLLADGMQCGGKGGKCSTELSACMDAQAKGVCCEPGHTCVRQNEWYWGCKKK